MEAAWGTWVAAVSWVQALAARLVPSLVSSLLVLGLVPGLVSSVIATLAPLRHASNLGGPFNLCSLLSAVSLGPPEGATTHDFYGLDYLPSFLARREPRRVPAFHKSCVVAPSRGPRDTADSRLHRLKGPHRLEAWRSGAKEAIALETKPGTKPGTNNLEIKLGTKLATSARPQDTAACRPHAPLSKLHIWGLGGWGACGLHGPPLGGGAQKPAQPSKEACGEAAPKEPLRHAANN